MWHIRESITPALQQKGFVYKYDISLPLNSFYEIVELMRMHLKNEPQLSCVGFGHLGDSNIHLNIVSSTTYNRDIEHLIESFMYKYIISKRGSISAEHGIGLRKRETLKKCKSNNTLETMKLLKNIFDPNNILNPYKLI